MVLEEGLIEVLIEDLDLEDFLEVIEVVLEEEVIWEEEILEEEVIREEEILEEEVEEEVEIKFFLNYFILVFKFKKKIICF